MTAWRETVRVSPLALGLVELPSGQFIELSPRARELLGTTDDEATGLEYRAIVSPRKEVEQTLRLLSASTLDSIQARRHLRRVDGSVVEVLMCGQAIRSTTGAELGLWVAVEVPTDDEQPAVTAALAELHDRMVSLELESPRPVVGMLDHRWRVTELSTEIEELLGHDPAEVIGTTIIDMTHPEDTAALLLAFARATVDVKAGVRLRLRDRNGTWQPIALVIVLDDHASSRLAFELAADDGLDALTRARAG